MLTLTYSSQDLQNQEINTRKILVETEADGRKLIVQWNLNSKNHCKGQWV